MMKKLKLRQATLIFNSIALVVLFGSFTIYTLFEITKEHIQKIAIDSQIEYINNITDNFSDAILSVTKKQRLTLYDALKNNEEVRSNLEKGLALFVTDRYKYVYIVDRDKNNRNEFRFLLDGSNSEEKSQFLEPYNPVDIEIWNSVYETKKEKYFEHEQGEELWITYLKPIFIHGEVSAIIAIDFSLHASEAIVFSLNELSLSFQMVVIFSVLLFFLIVGFSYIDTKREKAKVTLYNQLKNTNSILQDKTKELEEKSAKISQFNETLTQKVKDEVAKNREKDKQMLQQSRLAQMGEMIGMIAHQWRQPLAAISAASAAIKLKATLGKLEQAKTIELSSKISEYSQHLSTTIDDFREFFKPNKNTTQTNFNELVQSVLSIVAIPIQNSNIRIIKDLQYHDNFVSYPNELKQVILNLIKNAEDILTENQIQNPSIKISSYQENSDIILEVSDNGGGIPHAILDKVFDPYFSTKKDKDGTGLGLYMSKIIVETHCNGKLTVTNSSVGAVFKVYLKLIEQKRE